MSVNKTSQPLFIFIYQPLCQSAIMSNSHHAPPLSAFHAYHVLKCVHEDEGCREQWSSLGGHVSGHQHIISSHIHHQHHHHHYYIQFNHYYSIMSSDAKYEVLRVKSLKQHILQAIKESSKFGIY